MARAAAQDPANVMTFAQANLIQRSMRRLAATTPLSWFGVNYMHRLDRAVFRLTRGRHTALSLMSGLPVVLLTTTGARSGQDRTTPVLGFPTEDGLAVIASNFGQSKHPAWYHNLRAHPDASVVVSGRKWKVRAREPNAEARNRIWRQGLDIYPGWAAYERRCPDRRIGAFVLEPVQPDPS